MPLNFELAGKSYEPIELTVTASQIAEYASASGDANEAHQPGPNQVASATFSVVPAFAELGRVVTDPELGVDNPLMIVHGEQEFRYTGPLRPDDKIVMTPVLERVEDKGSGAIFVVLVTATTQSGDHIVDQSSTIFVRGAGSGAKRERDGRAAEPERGAEVAAFTSHVDVGMPSRYAVASGDHNPVHLDDNVARAVGLPGVINHGLGTLSLVAGGLVGRLAAGDVGRLQHLKVRFTDMVFPGSDVTTTVWVGPDPGWYLFETTRRPDGSVVMAGEFTVGGD